MAILIRLATTSDTDIIVHNNAAMAKETENKDLPRHILRDGVVNLFRQPQFGFYILAERPDGTIVGQLMITYEWSDWRNGVFWWIQSVYIDPEFRGMGVYRKLYHYVLEQARSKKDVCGIRLYVDKDNRKAMQVYHRCGMNEAHYAMYEVDFVLG